MYVSWNAHYGRSIIFWGERRGLGISKQKHSCTAKTENEIVHGEKHRASASTIICFKFLHELLPTKKLYTTEMRGINFMPQKISNPHLPWYLVVWAFLNDRNAIFNCVLCDNTTEREELPFERDGDALYHLVQEHKFRIGLFTGKVSFLVYDKTESVSI